MPTDSTPEKSPQALIGLVVLLAIFVLVLVFIQIPDRGNEAVVLDEPANETTEIGLDRNLNNFPATAPIPASATLTRQLNIETPEGQLQLTKQFISTKSLEENFEFFVDSLSADSNWEILAQNDSGSSRAIFARNSQGVLSVSIQPGPTGGEVLIDMSFVVAN